MASLRNILIILTLSAVATLKCVADVTYPIDSLRVELSKATNITDSLQLLVNIFDCGTGAERLRDIEPYYEAAVRAGDYTAQLDALRNWGNIGAARNDVKMVDRAIERMAGIPESEDKRQTMIFLRGARALAGPFPVDEERDNYTRQLLKTIAELPADTEIHEKVSRLLTLVILLRSQTQGDLMTQYLDDLDVSLNQLEQMPFNYLRSLYNAVATDVYWHNDQLMKSVRVDRNQLLNLKRMEEYTRKQGRIYRNYDLARYLCLERIARNYSQLSNKEFQDVIDQIDVITANDSRVAHLYENYLPVKIGILAKEGKYEEAIPLAKEIIDKSQDTFEKRHYARMLIELADSAGNAHEKHLAEIKNSHLLEEYVNYKTSERMRELQLLYDVNALRRHQLTHKLDTARSNNKFLLVVLIIFVLLTFAVGIMYMYERNRNHNANTLHGEAARTTDDCEQKIAKLEKQLDEARRRESEKLQLMTYISHELATPLSAITNYSQMIIDAVPDDEVKGYIKNFIDIIDSNTKVVQTVTGDMLEYALNESKPINVNRVPVEPNAQAQIAAETIEPRLNPGLSIEVKPAPGNPVIQTDPRRLQLTLLAAIDSMVASLQSGHIIVAVSVTETACRFVISAPGATPGPEPARVPYYPATQEVINLELSYNPEVPSLTVTVNL